MWSLPEGRVRVIMDPSIDVKLRPGEVLVAPYTDPAWTPLFLMAGPAVVELKIGSEGPRGQGSEGC